MRRYRQVRTGQIRTGRHHLMAKYPYNTPQWRTLRAAKLASSPWCVPCQRRGAQVRANTVDHIVSVARGGLPFPPLIGLMSMCASCHSVKTRGVDRPGGSGRAFKGCDASGNPVDAAHGWWGRAKVARVPHLELAQTPTANTAPARHLDTTWYPASRDAHRYSNSGPVPRGTDGGTSKDQRSTGVGTDRGSETELIFSPKNQGYGSPGRHHVMAGLRNPAATVAADRDPQWV